MQYLLPYKTSTKYTNNGKAPSRMEMFYGTASRNDILNEFIAKLDVQEQKDYHEEYGKTV